MSVKRTRRVLLGISILSFVAALVVLVATNHQNDQTAQADRRAEQIRNEQAASLSVPPSATATSTTVPATTSTIPSTTSAGPQASDPTTTEGTSTTSITTTLPETTTTVFAPVLPNPDSLPFNQVFGWLSVPDLQKGPNFTLSNTDLSVNAGYNGLKGGPALFLFWGWNTDANGVHHPDDQSRFSLPGGGGKVAIGGHHTTVSAGAPFAHLDQIQAGNIATIYAPAWATVGYQAAPFHDTVLADGTSCKEGTMACVVPAADLWNMIVASPDTGETLYMFTCDDGTASRTIVRFERVSLSPGSKPAGV